MKLIGLLFAAIFAFTARAETWTMDHLIGLAPEFDGPSCYTAALLAKGYVDTNSFVGSKELEFFLDRFCIESTGPLELGDFVTLTDSTFVTDRPHINHIATYLGDEMVFEKEGGAGKFKPYTAEDPHFLKRPMNESPWFNGTKLSGQVTRKYKCEDAKAVRAKTASCEARVNAFGLARYRSDFERLLYTVPAKFDPSASDVPVILRLSEELNNLSTSDPCYDYILAMGEMVGSSFKSIRVVQMEGLSQEWKNARATLERVLSTKFKIF